MQAKGLASEKLLIAREVISLLKEKGIKLSESSLRRYIYKKFIPEKYIVSEKRGLKTYYYFKPEVIDYLLEKLGKG